MGNAMRITKSLMQSTKSRLDQRVKSLFALTDDELVNFLKNKLENLNPNPTNREENLRVAILLSLQEFFPDSMIF